jgi:excisionase family DNA binding protein
METQETQKIEVLRVPEIAEILRIPRSRAYALVQNGEIGSFKIGERTVRVHRRALDEYMKQMPEGGAS